MSSAYMPSTSNSHTLDSLYREHQSWLIKRLRARLSCSQQAADFAQDTFLRILSSPDCNQRVAAANGNAGVRVFTQQTFYR